MNKCKWFECENDIGGICEIDDEPCNYIGLCPYQIGHLCETCAIGYKCDIYGEDGDSE